MPPPWIFVLRGQKILLILSGCGKFAPRSPKKFCCFLVTDAVNDLVSALPACNSVSIRKEFFSPINTCYTVSLVCLRGIFAWRDQKTALMLSNYKQFTPQQRTVRAVSLTAYRKGSRLGQQYREMTTYSAIIILNTRTHQSETGPKSLISWVVVPSELDL